MDRKRWNGRRVVRTLGAIGFLSVTAAVVHVAPHQAKASPPPLLWARHHACEHGECSFCDEVGGTWYWLRSPEDERRVIISLYNRYCVRCHGVDGRGVWDIPDVPDFTNARWQACHSDNQLTRSILEGRGACMPPFRGTLTLEEACAMARYLRTFLPGTEASRPDVKEPGKSETTSQIPAPRKVDALPK